jgi:hypothetical protein
MPSIKKQTAVTGFIAVMPGKIDFNNSILYSQPIQTEIGIAKRRRQIILM